MWHVLINVIKAIQKRPGVNESGALLHKLVILILLMACSSTNNSGVEQETQDPATDLTIFDGIYSIYEVSGSDVALPLTNGNAVGKIISGEIVFLYSDAGHLYFGKQTPLGLTTQLLINAGSPGTMTVLENSVLIIYMDNLNGSINALQSDDGGATFFDPITVGTMGVGAAVPSACLWQEGSDVKGLVAWVAPPTEEDRGPLYVVEITNDIVSPAIQVGTDEGYSAPSLSCPSTGQFMVVRHQVDTETEIAIHFGERVDGFFSLRELFYGADPSLCATGNHLWVGSHRGAKVNLAHSTDRGSTWASTQLDDSARFANVACVEDKVIAIYGDWPDAASAIVHDNATRQTIGKFSTDGGITFVTHQPVGDSGYQGPATAVMDLDGIAIVLKDSSREVVRVVVD